LHSTLARSLLEFFIQRAQHSPVVVHVSLISHQAFFTFPRSTSSYFSLLLESILLLFAAAAPLALIISKSRLCNAVQNESAKVTRRPAREERREASSHPPGLYMKILHLLSFLRRRAAAVRASYIFLLPVLFSQSLDAIVISPEASFSTYSTCVHMYASTRRPKMRPSVPLSFCAPAFCMRRVTGPKTYIEKKS
jgi:hypothetical protein